MLSQRDLVSLVDGFWAKLEENASLYVCVCACGSPSIKMRPRIGEVNILQHKYFLTSSSNDCRLLVAVSENNAK